MKKFSYTITYYDYRYSEHKTISGTIQKDTKQQAYNQLKEYYGANAYITNIQIEEN